MNGIRKTMVIGAKGLIGRYFYDFYKAHYPDTVGTHYKPTADLISLDLHNPSFNFAQLKKIGYSHVLITAAMASPMECEKEKERSFQCNVVGTLKLVQKAFQAGITPILLSTDYVFDGKAAPYSSEAKVTPINEYGRQKVQLEKTALEVCEGNCLIIRLSKIYTFDPLDRTLLTEIMAMLSRGERVKAAIDQIFAPIYILDIVSEVVRLQEKNACGIYHFAGKESLSRYYLTKSIAQKIGAAEDLVQPFSLDELSEGVMRPKNTTLLSNAGKMSLSEAIGHLSS